MGFFSTEIILHATKTEFDFFFFQGRYTSRLMDNSITQLKFIKQNFWQNLDVILASSWCTAVTLLRQGGTTLVTAGRFVAKGPEKWKEHTGLFCQVLITPFKRHYKRQKEERQSVKKLSYVVDWAAVSQKFHLYC